MITAGQLLNDLRHRLAGPAAVELGGPTRVLNLAGQWLDSIHAWQQRLRVSASLDFNVGDTTLALPANLKEIVAAEQSGVTQAGRSVRWIGAQDMLALRQGLGSFANFDLYVSIETSGTAWQLGIFQPPDVTTLDVLKISYRVGWTPVVDDKSQITVHPSLEGLLSHVVREYAAGLELGDLDARLAAIAHPQTGALLRAAKLADASGNRMLGPIQGGAVAMRSQIWDPWRIETQVL